jgi:hypothetical protein
MIRIGTLDAARLNRNHRRLPNGAGFWRSELITVDGGAQAFLVEQEPNSVVPPHFHLEDEFQVFFAGDGALGKRPVRPVAAHFAGRHTGYGPITAGPDGVTYMTLRARLDLGAHWLPEERHLMEEAPRRNLHSEILDVSSDEALQSRARASLHTAISLQEDGVGVWILGVPPGQPVVAPVDSGDRFYVVTAGVMRLHGASLPQGSASFVPATEPDFPGVAGDGGLEMLVLQFARTAAFARRLQ